MPTLVKQLVTYGSDIDKKLLLFLSDISVLNTKDTRGTKRCPELVEGEHKENL